MGSGPAGTGVEERRSPGRPREFNEAAALHAAMLVFWKFGYESASLTQLTEAMGISRPTLYATFGDKQGLFRQAVAAYTALQAAEYAEALALPTARAVAERWLRLSGGATLRPGVPPGCLLVQGVLVGSPESDRLRDELVSLRNEGTALVAERFERAQMEGDLPASVDARDLAQYLACLAHGISVESTAGITPQQLGRTIDLAMANWPGDTKMPTK